VPFLSDLIASVRRWFSAPPPAAEAPPEPTVHAPLADHLSDVTFASLNLPEPLLRGVNSTGFTHCTPIQAQTLPIALGGHDVMGQAQTGTGKTAAFLIALYTRLLTRPARPHRKRNQVRALVIAPTRELAVQIHKDAETLGQFTGLKLGLVYGGTGFEQQKKMLEDGVDILVGTPGRVIDYFKQHAFDLHECQVMVLDEADRMFDLGFIKDIRFLLRRLPKPQQRLSMLFSATLSFRVTELAYEHMNNPQQVSVTPSKMTADKVKESCYFPANEEKIPLLLGLLKGKTITRALVFVNTKPGAEKIGAYLRGNGYAAGVLSGDVHQKKRLRILKEFTEGKLQILVATDVAARGLHIPDVSHVFNYDLPQDAEDYVHRIGRTARAGATGEAVSFACETYAFSMGDIEKYIGHKIPVEKVDPAILVKPQPPVRDDDLEEGETLLPPRGRQGGRGGPGGRGRPHDRGKPRHRQGEHRRGDHPPRSEQTPKPAPPIAPPAAETAPGAPSGDSDAQHKRRRRRRGRRGGRSGGGGNDGGNTPPPTQQPLF
jgi:ATP-dependent RNA helicase RhlB